MCSEKTCWDCRKKSRCECRCELGFESSIFQINNVYCSYEDLRALDGGSHGLDVILPILKFASHRLVDGGHIALEVDPCHPLILPDEIAKCPEINLKLKSVHTDLHDKDRFIIFEK